MIELLAVGWVASPMEIIHAAQSYGWVHALIFSSLWLRKHWAQSERHATIRTHHFSGHKGSPFKCDTNSCATL
jgi:hypothetical protein